MSQLRYTLTEGDEVQRTLNGHIGYGAHATIRGGTF